MFISGCGAVRLAYTAGGRVVAGSNPVIPTFLINVQEGAGFRPVPLY